jgi:peptidoglycan/xylan/chitin deacetylase (PgdA/CDA1 family)
MKYIKFNWLILLICLTLIEFRGETVFALDNMNSKDAINTPSATIIFDDGSIEDYTIMYPYFKSKGIKGCSALVSSLTDKNSNYLNMRQIHDMDNYGWDFLSHTIDHLDLTKLSVEEIDYQLETGKKFYEDRGIKISGLVYPYNGYDDKVINETKKYFDAGFAFNYSDKPLYNSDLKNNRYNIYRVTLEMPLEDNKKIIDQAIENNGWLVFMGHGHYYRTGDYTDDSVWPGKWDNNVQKVKDTIDYLMSKGVRIITVREALAEKACTKLGWNLYNGKTYYLKSDYSLATGWESIDGKWYFFNKDYTMSIGWLKIDNKWYYFYPNGERAVNTTIDGYSISSSGILIT